MLVRNQKLRSEGILRETEIVVLQPKKDEVVLREVVDVGKRGERVLQRKLQLVVVEVVAVLRRQLLQLKSQISRSNRVERNKKGRMMNKSTVHFLQRKSHHLFIKNRMNFFVEKKDEMLEI